MNESGIVAVAGVEEDDFVRAVAGDCIEDRFREVAVRVDQCEAPAGADVGLDELLEEGRLAHAGLADDGQVPAAVVGADAEGFAAGAELDPAEHRHVRFVCRRWKVDRRFKFAALGELHGRGTDGGRGRVPERGEFLAREQESAATVPKVPASADS